MDHDEIEGESIPLQLTWDRIVIGPSRDTQDENTLILCDTNHGDPAVLVLDAEERRALVRLLLDTPQPPEDYYDFTGSDLREMDQADEYRLDAATDQH
jgi:hypothetical protein